MLSSRVVGGPSEGGLPVAGGGTIRWVLGNDGLAPWPEATTLRLVAGPALTCHSVEVPPIYPDQTVVVELEVSTVKVQAEMSYVLVAPGGQPFGEIMTAEVVPELLSAAASQKPMCALVSSPQDTAPDGAKTACGTIQHVEWTLANVGPGLWPADTRVLLVHSSLGHGGQVPTEIALPEVAAGMTLHVEVSAQMPYEVGLFKAMWAVMSPTNPDFGELLLAEFVVVEPYMDESKGCSKAMYESKKQSHERRCSRKGNHSGCFMVPQAKLESALEGGSQDPRYTVKVFNKYDLLQADAEADAESKTDPQPSANVLPVQCDKATAVRSSRNYIKLTAESEALGCSPTEVPLPKTLTTRSRAPCTTPRWKPRLRSPFWALMYLFTGLFLGPPTCHGSSTERGVIGTCGGTECVALLEASEAHIRVEGTVATIELMQTFRGSDAGGLGMTDASFAIPINDAAVVTNFTANIGGKFLKGVVKERRRAQRIYDEHVQAGCPAALGQQGASRVQKPQDARDLFRISIGNLPANAPAQVNLSLVQELAVEDSRDYSGEVAAAVRLLVPTAAPARYAPAGVQGHAAAAQVLEASGRQLPSVFAISASIHGDVRNASSPSHAGLVSLQWRGSEDDDSEPTAFVSMRLSGANVSEVACRTDFVLRLVLGRPGNGGHEVSVAASLLAPRAVLEKHPGYSTWAAVVEFVPRFSFEPEASLELIFLIDRSGSMRFCNGRSFCNPGPKVVAARSALQHFVRSSPVGAFVNIVGFGSHFKALFPEGSRELQEETFREALAYADRLEADFGGTEILAPLRWIQEQAIQKDRPRRIFVLTDGEVWNQGEVFDQVEEICGAAAPSCQLFALGIGSGASTALVEGLARAGRGAARFVGEGEEDLLEEQIVGMLAAALQPIFTDVSVEWPTSPLALRHQGHVPLLRGRRLRQEASAPSSLSNQSEIHTAMPPESAPAAADTGAGPGLFDTSAPPASAVLRQRSVAVAVEAAEEAEARRHEEDIARFISQGGVVEGPLQAPQTAPPILVGQRWAAYAFLGHLRDEDLPSEITLRALQNGHSVMLRAPVAARNQGLGLHTLAARHLVNTLEGRTRPHVRLQLPGQEDRRWQVAALGVAYGLATAQTSWLAVGELPEEPSQDTTNAQKHTVSPSKTSGISRSLSVLDLSHLGASMALRSFSRLGSSLSVYGLARLGSSLSVCDFSQLGASLALRSFSRLGSSIALLGVARNGLANGSAMGVNAGSSPVVQETPATSQQPPLLKSVGPRWPGMPAGFLAAGRPGEVAAWMPLLPLWRSSPASNSCLPIWSNSSWWIHSLHERTSSEETMRAGGLQLWILTTAGYVLEEGSGIEGLPLLSAAASGRLALSGRCELLAGEGLPLAQLNMGVAEAAVEVNFQQLIDAVSNTSEAALSTWGWKWTCPTLPSMAYQHLLTAQRFDGSFEWPQAFLRELGWTNASGLGVSAQELLPSAIFSALPAAEAVLASGTVISALRRCFSGVRQKWGLLERKALARLRAAFPVPSAEGAVALAERLVLVPALAVAAAQPGAPPTGGATGPRVEGPSGEAY